MPEKVPSGFGVFSLLGTACAWSVIVFRAVTPWGESQTKVSKRNLGEGTTRPSREQEIAHVSKALMGLRAEFPETTFLVLAQLNRESADGRKPRDSDLRECGQGFDHIFVFHISIIVEIYDRGMSKLDRIDKPQI